MRAVGKRWKPSLIRRYREWSRYVAPISIGVALASTLLVFFITGTDPDDLKALITTCIGLLGIIISFQIETLFRIVERGQAHEQHGGLLAMVEEFPQLLPPITAAAEASVTTLKETEIEQFRSSVSDVLVETQLRLQELAQGRLRTASSDSDLMLDRFKAAEKLIQATTDESDTSWWQGATGTSFFELNKPVAKNGQVERVWILNGPPDEPTLQVMQDQYEEKVVVLMVDAGSVDPRLLVNMTMMDKAFLHEDVPNKQGKTIEYLYSENASDLARAASRFAQLKARATVYTGRDSVDKLFPPVETPVLRLPPDFPDSATRPSEVPPVI